MKKIKYLIGILLIAMAIGFSAISTSLSITGKTQVVTATDDFKVYFSNVTVNGVQDLSLVQSETKLAFYHLLQSIGDTYTINYEITNASKFYDAKIDINCGGSNEYLSITNELNTTDNLLSKETRPGTLTLTKIKTIASNQIKPNEIICNIEATPIERTTTDNTTPSSPVKKYYIGREITIAGEKFNIIGSDEETVTLLARHLLGQDYRQIETNLGIVFSETNGWEYTPGPEDIDVSIWSPSIQAYLEKYKNFLEEKINNQNISIDLITLTQLTELGCTVPNDYQWKTDTSERTCAKSQHIEWLQIDYNWWTKSAITNTENTIWYISNASNLWGTASNLSSGIRPVVTIPKETMDNLLDIYYTGNVITVANEKFNVIKDNGVTVTALSQYNLGSNHRQSSTNHNVHFSEETGWDYSTPQAEIDIQTWSTNPKTYVNAYVEYLNSELESTKITGSLITLKELQELGCTAPSDYYYIEDINQRTCTNSPHKDWLINGQYMWTQSSMYKSETQIWMMTNTGELKGYTYNYSRGVRPVITFPKEIIR